MDAYTPNGDIVMSLQLGSYVVGICKEFRSEPWNNDPTKFNHRLIISRPYLDQYENEQTDVTIIDINTDDVHAVQNQVASFRNKAIICPVAMVARAGGRNGAWLSTRMPKNEKLQLLDSVVKQLAVQK